MHGSASAKNTAAKTGLITATKSAAASSVPPFKVIAKTR